VSNTCATQRRQRRSRWSQPCGGGSCKTVGSAYAMTIVDHLGMPDPIPRGNAALRSPISASAPEQPVLDVRNQPDGHRPRRTDRRLSEAVWGSCLVDGHFCGEDVSPPQLREGGMTGIIAVRRACIRRDASAESRACEAPWPRTQRFPAAGGDTRRGTVSSCWPGASVPAG
jgi:hypothetical protein